MQDELDAEREEWAAKIEAVREDTEKGRTGYAEIQRSQRATMHSRVWRSRKKAYAAAAESSLAACGTR